MKITVRLFAALADRAGTRVLDLALPADTTVDSAVQELVAGNPQLAQFQSHLLCAVNQEYVDKEHRLAEGDELALFPPVSGG